MESPVGTQPIDTNLRLIDAPSLARALTFSLTRVLTKFVGEEHQRRPREPASTQYIAAPAQ